MKPKLLLLQIPHGPTATPSHRRVTGRTTLTGVQSQPLLLHPVNALGQGRVSSTKPIDGHRQIVSDQHGDRRRPQRPVRRDVRGTVRVRGQPALTANDEFAGGVLSGDQVAGNNMPGTLRPARRHSQPAVARQGDTRPGELDQIQWEPPEPSSATEVEIMSLAAEHVHRISADGANSIDRHVSHKQPPS